MSTTGIPSIAPRGGSSTTATGDNDSLFSGKMLLIGAAGVAIVGLTGLIMLNYKDAMLGKNVKSVIQSSLVSQGATYEKGVYKGGPIKEGVVVPENEAISGILGTFVQFMNGGKGTPPAEQGAGGPNEYDEVSKYANSQGMSLGMPDEDDDDHAPSSHRGGGGDGGGPGSRRTPPAGVVHGDVNEDDTFATFSLNERPRSFDPQALLRKYERAGAGAQSPGDDDDERGGGSSDDGGDGDYIDVGIKKLGKCPKFPEDPIDTTNGRGGQGNSYTDGQDVSTSGERRRSSGKRVRFAEGHASRGLNAADHPGTSVAARRGDEGAGSRRGGSGKHTSSSRSKGSAARRSDKGDMEPVDREQLFRQEMADEHPSPDGGEYSFDQTVSLTYNPNAQ